MASGGERIAESLNKCVENLVTAAEALQKLTKENGSSNCEIPTVKPSELEEHRKLFGFKPLTHTNKPKAKFTSNSSSPSSFKRFKTGSGKVFLPVRNTWTHKFFLFASTTCKHVPTTREKVQHGLAGLGERDIVLQKDGNAEHVRETLCESYPVLKECGGFEVMRTVAGSCKVLEVLPVPPGGYSVPYLKSCLLQAKGYIRPIQKQLSLEPLSSNDECSEAKKEWPKEKCLNCLEEIPINVLRAHTENCLGAISVQDSDICKQSECADMALSSEHQMPMVVDLTHTDEKNCDKMLAEIMNIFPNKSYREVQKKFAKEGTVAATVAAFLEQDDEELTKSVFDVPSASPLTLHGFRQIWQNSGLEQKIVIDRHSQKLLREIFKLYKKGLNIRGTPDVEFKGEEGSDASGPTREYFCLAMSRLVSGDPDLHLFEGEEDHLVPIHCIESYDSMLFYYTGLMISHSVLHEGYPLVGLSEAVMAYIVTGSIDEAVQYVSLQDIPDLEIREMIERVRNAETNEELNQLNKQESVVNNLVAAGFVNKLLTKENKDVACEKAILHFALMSRKLEMDDIRRGMEIIQLASTMEKNRHLWKEVFPRSNDIKVTSSVLLTKITLQACEGDINEHQKQAFEWCKDYVAQLPVSSVDQHLPTTGRFLQFVLGSPMHPNQPIYVKFNRKEKSLPDPEACLGILSIPTNCSTFAEFKQRMDATISMQAVGYGRF